MPATAPLARTCCRPRDPLTACLLVISEQIQSQPCEGQYPHGSQIREFRGSFHAGFWGGNEILRIQKVVAFSFKKIFLFGSACSFTQSGTCGCSPRLGGGRDWAGCPCPRRSPARMGPAAGLREPWGSISPTRAGPHPVLLTNHPPSSCCPQAETLPWGEGGAL